MDACCPTIMRTSRTVVGAAAIAVSLLLGSSRAEAHARVVVGGFVGVPWAPYPYYYGYAPYPYPYPYYAPYSVPPPGWEAGHFEWRQDSSGRRFRVWVPPYLR
jgi:hypothetical protein